MKAGPEASPMLRASRLPTDTEFPGAGRQAATPRFRDQPWPLAAR